MVQGAAVGQACKTVLLLLTGASSGAPVVLGTHLALALAQQLVGGPRLPRLLLLTCGTQAATRAPAASDAAYGGVWGFARVLRLEHPSLRTQSTDVSRGAMVVASLTMLAPTTETEAAWTGNLHVVARLRASTASSSQSNITSSVCMVPC